MDRLTWQRTDVTNRLRFLDRPEHLRKLRLFSVACCRRIEHWLADPRLRPAVEVVERRADGQATESAVRNAQRLAQNAHGAAEAPHLAAHAARGASAEARAALARATAVYYAAWAVRCCLADSPLAVADNAAHAAAAVVPHGAWGTQGWATAYRAASRRERQQQKRLLDDLFGNVFQPVRFDPSWRTPTAVALVLAAYRERRWEDLPVLADALEEAGCADAELLAHLRGPGPHVRGCWAVDLVLGKE